MVGNITSLTGHGLRDWLVQRISALILGLYVIVLATFWITHPEITFDAWHDLFSHTAMKVLSSIAWLSMVLHSWIGLWTVTTDYLKSTGLRLTLQMFILLGLLSLFFWGIFVFWGV